MSTPSIDGKFVNAMANTPNKLIMTEGLDECIDSVKHEKEVDEHWQNFRDNRMCMLDRIINKHDRKKCDKFSQASYDHADVNNKSLASLVDLNSKKHPSKNTNDDYKQTNRFGEKKENINTCIRRASITANKPPKLTRYA